jgi:hypothetical protein
MNKVYDATKINLLQIFNPRWCHPPMTYYGGKIVADVIWRENFAQRAWGKELFMTRLATFLTEIYYNVY